MYVHWELRKQQAKEGTGCSREILEGGERKNREKKFDSEKGRGKKLIRITVM